MPLWKHPTLILASVHPIYTVSHPPTTTMSRRTLSAKRYPNAIVAGFSSFCTRPETERTTDRCRNSYMVSEYCLSVAQSCFCSSCLLCSLFMQSIQIPIDGLRLPAIYLAFALLWKRYPSAQDTSVTLLCRHRLSLHVGSFDRVQSRITLLSTTSSIARVRTAHVG